MRLQIIYSTFTDSHVIWGVATNDSVVHRIRKDAMQDIVSNFESANRRKATFSEKKEFIGHILVKDVEANDTLGIEI